MNLISEESNLDPILRSPFAESHLLETRLRWVLTEVAAVPVLLLMDTWSDVVKRVKLEYGRCHRGKKLRCCQCSTEDEFIKTCQRFKQRYAQILVFRSANALKDTKKLEQIIYLPWLDVQIIITCHRKEGGIVLEVVFVKGYESRKVESKIPLSSLPVPSGSLRKQDFQTWFRRFKPWLFLLMSFAIAAGVVHILLRHGL